MKTDPCRTQKRTRKLTLQMHNVGRKLKGEKENYLKFLSIMNGQMMEGLNG